MADDAFLKFHGLRCNSRVLVVWRKELTHVGSPWNRNQTANGSPLPTNLTSGARRLRRIDNRHHKTLERGSGVNAALRFRGSLCEISFRRNLSPR